MSETEHCPNCGTEITEPSAFCHNCGASLAEATGGTEAGQAAAAGGTATATQAPPMAGQIPPGFVAAPASEEGAKRSWLPFAAIGGAVVVVAAIVAVLLLTLGGSGGSGVRAPQVTRQQALALLAANGTTTVSQPAPGLYAVVQAGRLHAVVPAGWKATAQQAGATSRVQFLDPKQAASGLTIQDQPPTGGNDHGRAVTTRNAATSKHFSVSSFGPVIFPGGTQAWRLTYSNAGTTHSIYFYSACSGHDVLEVDISAPDAAFNQKKTELGIVASSVEPLCGAQTGAKK